MPRAPGTESTAPGRGNPRRVLGGIALTVGACACFAVLDATSKHVALAGMPVVMALWLRYLFQAVLATAYVLHREGPAALRTSQPRFQALRAVLFAATSFFAYLSLRFMPLAELTAIGATTPLCVTLVAAFWLRQHVSPARWALAAVGLAGAVLIARPGGAIFTWALLLPLGMLAAGTGYQVISSTMAGRESPATTQFYTGWLATALVSLALPFAWQAVSDPRLWAGTFAMGVASALGHLMLLNAYARATPTTIAPFLYSQIAFAVLAGWWVYGHVPDRPSLLGMAAIAASGAAGAWLTVRESR
ncbi:DMT family transporter [Paracidovorax cattleyae]|uniref:Permease of the drug/metabolite transporter (DMT) superfamily n=1 Tax=Paracidovorax cattleyae TaxID=80868 RepID=A0A1H0QFI1_9BURK|nr:DMT family transporter [Paracidovorax cattleyae]SDP16044.1 Permease of the drug/metabolite transporter (DMT) superfamily [Paracidovorax cattleyae]